MTHAARVSEAIEQAENQAEMARLTALIADARALVDGLELERERAAKLYHFAREGQRGVRLKALLEATNAALIAECKLSQLVREAGAHG